MNYKVNDWKVLHLHFSVWKTQILPQRVSFLFFFLYFCCRNATKHLMKKSFHCQGLHTSFFRCPPFEYFFFKAFARSKWSFWCSFFSFTVSAASPPEVFVKNYRLPRGFLCFNVQMVWNCSADSKCTQKFKFGVTLVISVALLWWSLPLILQEFLYSCKHL